MILNRNQKKYHKFKIKNSGKKNNLSTLKSFHKQSQPATFLSCYTLLLLRNLVFTIQQMLQKVFWLKSVFLSETFSQFFFDRNIFFKLTILARKEKFATPEKIAKNDRKRFHLFKHVAIGKTPKIHK